MCYKNGFYLKQVKQPTHLNVKKCALQPLTKIVQKIVPSCFNLVLSHSVIAVEECVSNHWKHANAFPEPGIKQGSHALQRPASLWFGTADALIELNVYSRYPFKT